MIVKLTYFKSNGKYYAEGEFITSSAFALFEIWEEVRKMREDGRLPGLVEGAREFIISVDVPTHPHAHPHLILL